MLGHLARVLAQARIKLRLSAAGLCGREFHVHTQTAKNADDSLAGFGVERIDQTCDEKLYCGHVFIVNEILCLKYEIAGIIAPL